LGGFKPDRAKAIMEDKLRKVDYPMEVTVVVYRMAKIIGKRIFGGNG
jgi:hypothetical protein